MKSKGAAKGILKSIRIVRSIEEDESLSSAIDEDYELTKLVSERTKKKSKLI